MCDEGRVRARILHQPDERDFGFTVRHPDRLSSPDDKAGVQSVATDSDTVGSLKALYRARRSVLAASSPLGTDQVRELAPGFRFSDVEGRRVPIVAQYAPANVLYGSVKLLAGTAAPRAHRGHAVQRMASTG